MRFGDPRDIGAELRMRSAPMSLPELRLRRVRFCKRGEADMSVVGAAVDVVRTGDGSVGAALGAFASARWRHQVFVRRAKDGVLYGDILLHVGCLCREVE